MGNADYPVRQPGQEAKDGRVETARLEPLSVPGMYQRRDARQAGRRSAVKEGLGIVRVQYVDLPAAQKPTQVKDQPFPQSFRLVQGGHRPATGFNLLRHDPS